LNAEGYIAKLARTLKACQLMKIRTSNFKISSKITAKKTIKVLVLSSIFLWLAMYVYMFSNKSFDSVFNYENYLSDKRFSLIDKLKNLPVNNSVPIYKRLAIINLCQNNLRSAQDCIIALCRLTRNESKSLSLETNLFIANIYRDFQKLKLAQSSYEVCIFDLSKKLPNRVICSTTGENDRKGKIFNNMGISYFLQAEMTANKKERKKNYLIAIDYFKKALSLQTNCLSLNNIIQNNLAQTSIEIQFLE
jgi:tetratricopeptide (TPR) repeat protein